MFMSREKKTAATLIATMFCATAAFAQTEVPDTIQADALAEITVQAPKVIHKADMDVFYPSKSAVESSKDGMALLRNMLIPTMTVNDVLGTVTSSGKDVQVRINGRVATIDQVKELLPETIKRVEWTDNPGLRYNGATAVVNFIVANPTLGGSLMAQAMPSLNTAFGNYGASLKLNNGRSQWGVSANYKLTNKIDAHREYTETFTRPDGSILTRTETPVDGYVDDTSGSLQLDYSYIKPDTTVLWVAIRGDRRWPEGSMFDGLMSLSNGDNDIRLRDCGRRTGFSPVLSAYLEQHFTHNQLIAVDFNASLYNGRTVQSYTEQVAGASENITDVNTSIKDRNSAYGIEADYIRNWRNSKLTAGVSYTANRNRSTYENLGGEVFNQRQDKVYLFAEYFRRIGKVTLTGGLGAQYTSFHFRETNQGNSSWNLRPQFSATYKPAQSHQLRLGFTSWQTAPSLAETNVAPQQLDGFQWQIGNPNLKTSSSYMLSLNYNFMFPRVMGALGLRAFSSPDAITACYNWADDRLVTSFENSDGLQNLAFYLSPQVEVIPDWVMMSGTLQYKAERMKGRGYRHYNHNWSGGVTAVVQHWGFNLMAQYQKSESSLFGEKLTWGESYSVVSLGYGRDNWEIAAGVYCPFTKYDQGARLYNRYNTNEMHLRIDMAPMPFLQFSYNLQWGRQKRGAGKLVNVDAGVDSSKATRR